MLKSGMGYDFECEVGKICYFIQNNLNEMNLQKGERSSF